MYCYVLPILVSSPRVQRGEPLHLAFGERKIPHGEVLGDVGGGAAPRNSEVCTLIF